MAHPSGMPLKIQACPPAPDPSAADVVPSVVSGIVNTARTSAVASDTTANAAPVFSTGQGMGAARVSVFCRSAIVGR